MTMSAHADVGDHAEVEAVARTQARLEQAHAICAAEPRASFENVWHALILLEDTPLDRLNRSLIRGRATPLLR